MGIREAPGCIYIFSFLKYLDMRRINQLVIPETEYSEYGRTDKHFAALSNVDITEPAELFCGQISTCHTRQIEKFTLFRLPRAGALPARR